MLDILMKLHLVLHYTRKLSSHYSLLCNHANTFGTAYSPLLAGFSNFLYESIVMQLMKSFGDWKDAFLTWVKRTLIIVTSDQHRVV